MRVHCLPCVEGLRRVTAEDGNLAVLRSYVTQKRQLLEIIVYGEEAKL